MMRFPHLVCSLLLALLAALHAPAAEAAKSDAKKSSEKKDEKPKTSADSLLSSGTFTGLELRGIGPAQTSGRITDVAIDQGSPNTWYVAVAYGGVWKTTNAGTTWTPIFDDQGTSSIGCVTIDPNDPHIVWVGTGENNSQRSVGWGDGVYKSVDGGKSWEKSGLGESEHIGKIVVDPRNSAVVYVAAQGPLWRAGGDRGVYKTTDGGATWNRVLEIGEYTGVNEVHIDPRNPDVLIASAYQRHRRVWTLIDGGPESAIYKSTDAGANWKKMTTGIPKVDKGRIGLAVSPADPEVVYAIVEAANKEGGVFRSKDAGTTWEKRGDYMSGSPQYYNELIADPADPDRVYSMDTWMHVSEDGGKTFTKVGEKFKHVDNHALWIDPTNTDHLIAGCDGGIYDSHDRGATWRFYSNMPITQFYKVCVDSAEPFYNIYGGTQDNNTIGGPSQTRTAHGITNFDWFITIGGDGFQAVVDPTDPNIVYAQAQHGVLNRFDRKTGEAIDIQPQPEEGEALRWNWDSPLVVSPHLHTRLYFAANKLFRTDDRGESWRAVSQDLTRRIDRNRLKIMDRVWSVDAVAKNASTSFYGNIVALAESPLREGLLFVGTDDGLVQISKDGGENWRRNDRVPGVPDTTYVSRLTPSRHDADLVYAAFDNHKRGDFKPYVYRSDDLGNSWTSISGDLPENGSVYVIEEDHVDRNLLFCGTEFGVFFTRDGGKRWIQLKGGMPVAAVRDLAIQRRENDLVVATFGRSFYILDDYTPLRMADLATLQAPATLFPVKTARTFIPSQPLGLKEKASQGDAFFVAPNPPFGAVFTYYFRNEIKSRKKTRLDAERMVSEKGGDVFYPSWDSLRAEDREEKPTVLLTVTDQDGNVVRRIPGTSKSGFQRVAWDLRYPAANPTEITDPDFVSPWDDPAIGPLAVPGTYRVTLSQRIEGRVTDLAGPVEFRVAPLGESTLPPPDPATVAAFSRKASRLQRAVLGAVEATGELKNRIKLLKAALDDTPGADAGLAAEARALEARLLDVETDLSGDSVRSKRSEPAPPSISDRVRTIVLGYWLTTSGPTATHRREYDTAARGFSVALSELSALDRDLSALEQKADRVGAPWTPGRIPAWTAE